MDTPTSHAAGRDPAPGAGRGSLKTTLFGAWGIILVLAVGLPPVYLAASRAEPWVLVPFSVGFILVHGLLAVLMVLALYLYEVAHGELELFHDGEGEVANRD